MKSTLRTTHKESHLSELKTGQQAIIVKVTGHGAFRKRIIEMGFVRGQRVTVLLNAPLKDPVKYEVMGYEVSLRRSEAAMIRILPLEEAAQVESSDSVETLWNDTPSWQEEVARAERTINIALVGNPNCGKTSLFNVASGAHEHVGNYSGVTVDAKMGHFTHKGYRFNIYDLPGTYSLSAYTPEELYVRNHLTTQTPDVVVNVLVASNLERNLYLTTELIDMDLRTVVALNMYDELERSGSTLDHNLLGGMLGVPLVPTVTRTGKGIEQLFDTIIAVYESRQPEVRHVHVNHGRVLERCINKLSTVIKESVTQQYHCSPRYLAIKLLEGDSQIEQMLQNEPSFPVWIAMRQKAASRITELLNEDVESAISNGKYGFIAGALRETFTANGATPHGNTTLIDKIVTHKYWGFPLFLFIMWFMFQCTFTLGGYPMAWIESGVNLLADTLTTLLPHGIFKDLVIDGIIQGVGGVIVFLPNILILYFFISLMEDSGYMARAAFIMDKMMHRIGLHGKSFIPLIMGFGCNVPAIMATRTIESKSSRLITILINPFVSCSARLPVYLLFVGAFFPQHASWVLLGLYLLGIVVAVITAKLLRKFYFKRDETPFVMELPPYRLPTGKAILRHMWGKAAQYLRKMGGIILLASIVVWFLSTYPKVEQVDGAPLTTEQHHAQQKNSYIGQLGNWVQPALAPLGFDWKLSVSLLTGVAAKEVVVSTFGVLYDVEEGSSSQPLEAKIKQPNPETGKPDFTPLTAIAFMAFVLLYLPCLASVVAVCKESGSWFWGLFTIVYSTGVAWLIAFLITQVGGYFL